MFQEKTASWRGTKPQILVAAMHSGSGKTTFTMGLLRALRRKGLRTQAYKCGPDYIDTQFHSLASGRESLNLDTWLSSEKHLREVYSRCGLDADACIVEGVMGLFDGYDRMKGSCAEIAGLLDIPVLLVVGSRSMAYTVAAQLHGLKTFRQGLRIAGAVFNQVSSESHFRFLKQACDDAGLPCFGYLPKEQGLEVPPRHLGLTLAAEKAMDRWIDRAADVVESHIDIPALLAACANVFPECPASCGSDGGSGPARVAVARDSAFNFIYRENIAWFERRGRVEYFSPLSGDSLPDADLLYLPGGYPELFARELSERDELRSRIRAFAESGGRILAECGGMIFLSRSIVGVDGGPYPMCAVFPFSATMEGARLHLGYRSLVLPSGRELRGHEFHYSSLEEPDSALSVARQTDARGREVETGMYRYKNVIAGYTHLYWAESGIMDIWEK